MKTFWLHATLLPLFLAGSALPEKQNQCKGSIPQIQRVVVHGTVSVPCPNFIGSEMTFTLYQGTNRSTVDRNFTHVRESKYASAEISHQVNTEDNSTKFVLKNVTEDQTGLYTCEAVNTFPPPMLGPKEGPQIIVIVEETHQQTARRCDPPTSHLSLWVGLGLLSLYGLIVTFTAFLLRSRVTNVDFNKHDYMNVRPKPRGKKQGILHPVRLSWNSDNTASIAPSKLSSKRLPN